MTYEEFKEQIEKTELSSEDFYKSMISQEPVSVINDFYKAYIKEEVSEEEEAEKYTRVEFFLEQSSDNQTRKDYYNDDALTQYMNYVGSIKKISNEERMKLLKDICKLRKRLETKGINNETITNDLKKYGVEIQYFTIPELDKKAKELLSKENVTKKVLSDLDLFIKYESAVQKFMEYNLKLVVKIAKMTSFRKSIGSLEVNDIVQEGNIGLRRAIQDFDPERNCQFSTYAYAWIRQAIERAIDDKSKTIRIPVHMHELFRQVARKERELVNKLGRNPSDEELAEALDITIAKLNEIRKFNEDVVSLDTPVKNDDDADATLGDFIADHNIDVEKNIDDFSDKEQVNQIFAKRYLTLKERLIIVLRFGLDFEQFVEYKELWVLLNDLYSDEFIKKLYNKLCNSSEALTLDQCGQIFQITRERIRQIEAKALRKLRIRETGKRNLLKK